MNDRNITVYYDGECPLCDREISFYRRRTSGDAVRYVNVCGAEAGDLGTDLDVQGALARFHVRDEDGALESGAQAFGRLWLATPGLAWAGKLIRLPIVSRIADRAYDAFLVVRPYLQAIAARRRPSAVETAPAQMARVKARGDQNGKRMS